MCILLLFFQCLTVIMIFISLCSAGQWWEVHFRFCWQNSNCVEKAEKQSGICSCTFMSLIKVKYISQCTTFTTFDPIRIKLSWGRKYISSTTCSLFYNTVFVAVHTSISPRLPLWTNHSREWNRTDQSERNLCCYGVNRLTGHDLEGQWNRWLDFTNPI